MIEIILKYNFIQNAIIAALLASVICGVIGSIVVEKKLVSMSGGIAHTSFGGIGLGYLLGVEPIIFGLLFAIIASFSISKIKRSSNTNSDTLIGMFWSGGMALGIMFIAFRSGYSPDMTSYLFGDILTVSRVYIYIMMVLTIIIVFAIVSRFSQWKVFLFDEEFASVIGVKTINFEYLLYVLISISVVILIKVVGITLVIALLSVPPAIAKLFTYNLKRIMIISSIIGAFLCLGGLTVSYFYNIPSGATIILLAIIIYLLAIIIPKNPR